ncbi:uncharacterized protein At4g37920-like [Actinidia eriantha]|uniref:uncharacterized protein At4g37920-like n=1 Tax=Actinidia eriantha TaxID=165200 RepID=UPI002585565D|nr:uncharacterized protein At4g37920-like [Actinidia eriantha]
MLMIIKAWSFAKESHMVKDEAKDIMYYLYMNTREHMQKNVSKEARILKYILIVEDTYKLLYDLKDAFTPGGELVENPDFVYAYQIAVFQLLAQSTYEGQTINGSQSINESMQCQFLEIHPPSVLDLSQDTKYAYQAAL